ncbi:hypothetical protein [Nitrososphaera sp.]|uniref:hypothetical protein n=1 Tax=Nitrososphaera sp. TaxID=1971748 RepID=UPI00179A0938|nr:hypothetical protein [Nitrososphaera sp.]NWG36024.1 hypothetical protein [Nitrososphaera sp.]
MTEPAKALYYAAAAATAIAGMLHLMMGPGSLGFNANQGILFIVGGIAQVFWIIPMIRRWGAPWYAVGIGGTVVFIALWVITRMPDNPITGRAGPASNPTAILIEVCQAIFVGLAAAVLVYESRRKGRTEIRDTGFRPAKHMQKTAILAGVVVALVLIGAFALPAAMPRPSGPPPGQGGPQGAGPQAQGGASTSGAGMIMPLLLKD